MAERRRGLRTSNVVFAFWLSVVSLFVFLSFSAQGDEARARRDQTCIVFERLHQADIKRLAGTYQYVAHLTPQQRRERLSVAVIRQIPQLERQVRNGKPPTYCKGDVGLDDSKLLPVPKRPPGIP